MPATRMSPRVASCATRTMAPAGTATGAGAGVVVGGWVVGMLYVERGVDDPCVEDDVVLEAPPEVAIAMTAIAATTSVAPPAMRRERFTTIPFGVRMSQAELRREVSTRSLGRAVVGHTVTSENFAIRLRAGGVVPSGPCIRQGGREAWSA